jgi:CRP-like cAMP-binding protein
MQLRRSDLSPRFVDLFRKTLEFTEEEFEMLLARFRVEFVPKRFHFVKPGDITRDQPYVNKGCARTYVLDREGREHIMFFAFEDWWIGDIESYMTQSPGTLYVQAIEDLELLCISHKDFQEMTEVIPKCAGGRPQAAKGAVLHDPSPCRSEDAQPRAALLEAGGALPLDRSSGLPLQDIASYLDIEPGSLSRMRKRMLEGERNS